MVKLLDMTETASGSNVQSQKNTCYRNVTLQNKAWHEPTKCIVQKSLTDHETERTRRYDGTHVNIAWQKQYYEGIFVILLHSPQSNA